MQDRLAGIISRFDSRTLDLAALAASLILAVLVAQALASMTWALLPEPSFPPPPTTTAAVTPGAAQPADFEQLAALHLFGQARPDGDTRGPGGAPLDAPETRLNLTLRGILFNSMGEMARAIIAAPGQPDQHYRIGDDLPGGATIDAIYADRVMLLRNGRYETLRLPTDSLDVAGGGSGGRSAPAGRAAPAPSPAGGTLSEYRAQILENPQNAMQYIQASPINTGGGGIGGFRVAPGSDPRLFEMAGLQEGDIVTAVNGVQLDSMDKGLEAMESLATSEEVTVTLQRNGREYNVRLNFRN